MKIFFDHKIFTNQIYGGPSRYFCNLVDELNSFDTIKAKIFSPFHINQFLKNLDKKNIGFANRIPFQEKFSKSPRLKSKLMNMNNYVNRFFYDKFKPDIIHTTYYDRNFFKIKKKLVVTVFDLIHEIYREEFNFPKEYYPKKEVLDVADYIICISNSTKNDLIKYYNIPESKISVTYLATDFKFSEMKSVIEGKYFLYVGSRWKYKNFLTLLKVLKKEKNILQNFKLVIFGGGKLSKKENELIDEYNLDKTKILQLTGDDTLLKSLYRNAEFFIYPTKYEGFGIPLLESFSQKCPVICSNISSLKEVGGNAVSYFDPEDIDSIHKEIEKVTTNRNERNQLIERGLIRLESFSWKKCASETLDIYKKLI